MSVGDLIFLVLAIVIPIAGAVLIYSVMHTSTDRVGASCVLVVLTIGMVAFAVQCHANTVQTRNARSNVRKDHPTFVIQELSTSDGTITYSDGGVRICSTALLHLNHRWLVATQGAKCAQTSS